MNPPPPRSSLRQLLAQELPRLTLRARRYCKSDSDAHDLVQETVARALSYETTFEPGSNHRAWLERIQRNLFVSRYRKLARERRALSAIADDPCSWIHGETPPSMQSLPAPAAGALSELPQAFRRVVELVDLADLSYQDAASALGVPVGTVMSRLHRARLRLAVRLSDAEPPLAA